MLCYLRVIMAAALVACCKDPAAAQLPDPTTSPLACPLQARSMARLELFFGAQRSAGGVVSPTEWEAFLDAEITPRFPDGLTWFEGRGQWRGRDGVIIKEETRILIVWTEAGDATEARIEAIRSAYKSRFDQDSVMRVHGWSCVNF